MSKSVKCAVVGCQQNTRASSSFNFPDPRKTMDRYIKWMKATGNKSLLRRPPEEIRRAHRICSRHFRDEDLIVTSKRTKPRRDAVPLLHLPDESLSFPEVIDLLPLDSSLPSASITISPKPSSRASTSALFDESLSFPEVIDLPFDSSLPSTSTTMSPKPSNRASTSALFVIMNQKHVVLVQPKKKSRSANFSSGEKTLLLSLINEFKGVIENKKTDAVTLEEKTNAWWQVTERFNSESPNMIPRSLDSLKKFYTNKKKDLRKRAADERKSRITGGGSCQLTVTDKEDDLLLSIIGSKTLHGLQNSLSDHNILPSNAQDPIAITERDNLGEDLEHSVPVYVVTNAGDPAAARKNNNEESPSALLYMIDDAQQPPVVIETVAGPSTSSSLTSSSNENVLKTDDVNVGDLIRLKKYNQKNLQKPTSTALQNQSKGAVADPNRRKPSPVVKALTSSLMAEMLNSLLDKRSAIADYTKQYLEEKIARKRREAALKEESLQLDIAIKKEQLKKLQGTSSK